MSDKAIIVLSHSKEKGMSLMEETMRIGDERTASGEPRMTKIKIGTATYEISLYFSKTSTENVQDKLRRIIIKDYVNEKKISD